MSSVIPFIYSLLAPYLPDLCTLGNFLRLPFPFALPRILITPTSLRYVHFNSNQFLFMPFYSVLFPFSSIKFRSIPIQLHIIPSGFTRFHITQTNSVSPLPQSLNTRLTLPIWVSPRLPTSLRPPFPRILFDPSSVFLFYSFNCIQMYSISVNSMKFSAHF